VWGEESREVAEDDDEHAVVEEVGPEAELALTQELRRIALPGVRLAVEADQAADEQHREAHIGIDAEEQRVDVIGGQHDAISAFKGLAPVSS
jgi:hypothetical protein